MMDQSLTPFLPERGFYQHRAECGAPRTDNQNLYCPPMDTIES
jgi:hypothetical protein